MLIIKEPINGAVALSGTRLLQAGYPNSPGAKSDPADFSAEKMTQTVPADENKRCTSQKLPYVQPGPLMMAHNRLVVFLVRLEDGHTMVIMPPPAPKYHSMMAVQHRPLQTTPHQN